MLGLDGIGHHGSVFRLVQVLPLRYVSKSGFFFEVHGGRCTFAWHASAGHDHQHSFEITCFAVNVIFVLRVGSFFVLLEGIILHLSN